MRLLGEFGELGGYPKPLERFARRVFGLPPTQDDAEGVAQMTAARWVTMPERVWTIYRTDPIAGAKPGSPAYRYSRACGASWSWAVDRGAISPRSVNAIPK